MNVEKREYYGGALNSFVVALEGSESIVKKLLADAGVERIDPEKWYDYDWSVAFFYKIGEMIGPSALRAVGKRMIETAVYPPGLDTIPAMLMGLGYAFKLNSRGSGLGDIICTIEDDYSATIDYSVRGPCALCIGIIEGSCARVGVKPLIEHGSEGCRDKGAPTCIYHVSW